MSEADETDSDSDEYVPSLEDSEDIAPLVARTYDQVKSQITVSLLAAASARLSLL